MRYYLLISGTSTDHRCCRSTTCCKPSCMSCRWRSPSSWCWSSWPTTCGSAWWSSWAPASVTFCSAGRSRWLSMWRSTVTSRGPQPEPEPEPEPGTQDPMKQAQVVVAGTWTSVGDVWPRRRRRRITRWRLLSRRRQCWDSPGTSPPTKSSLPPLPFFFSATP